MTPERLAEIRKKVSVGVYYSDTLVRELLDHIAQLEAQRGVAVVEFADHRFSVNCDTAQKGGNQAIYVNNDTTGVGYQIAGTDIDGHFKRKTWDLTPYMRPFIETIGIRPIPADRVLADGMMGVDRFGTGFVEACGILAAKPFDRPTTAACLIREGGMVSSLLATTSDGPGISILREEMRSELDALRGAKGGEVAG